MRLAEDSGGEIYYVDHPERGDRSVLVTPLEFVDGETPLIVSLHGYGGNSADHTTYVPLHERVNTDGFALLLPNGTLDSGGNQFWNPTDRCCDGGKSGEDDVAYLTELVASAKKVKDFGPVYFFGYSNGGSWRTTWPARVYPAFVPLRAWPAQVTSRTLVATGQTQCPCCTSTVPKTP